MDPSTPMAELYCCSSGPMMPRMSSTSPFRYLMIEQHGGPGLGQEGAKQRALTGVPNLDAALWSL